MKQLLWLALLSSALIGNTAFAAHCSNSTLRGTLIGAAAGVQNGVRNSGMFMESWDGAGNIQYAEYDTTANINSGVYYGTATYSISPDCIATVVYDGYTPFTWKYFVDPDGKGYVYVNSFNIGGVQAGRMEWVTESMLVDPLSAVPGPCSSATTTGVFNFSSAMTDSSGMPKAHAGVVTFDGAGHFAIQQLASDGYTTTPTNTTGTYAVSDRCIVTTAGGATWFVAPTGSAIWYTGSGQGSVDAGKAIRVSRPGNE